MLVMKKVYADFIYKLFNISKKIYKYYKKNFVTRDFFGIQYSYASFLKE